MAITLLDMLLQGGMINREQFDEALKNRVLYGGKIGTSLIELGYVSEEDLARFLARKLAVPYVGAEQLLAIDPEVIALVPAALAIKYRVIPLKREKKRLHLVMADPADLAAIDEIAFITGFVVQPLIAPEIRLLQALGIYYQFSIDERARQVIARIACQAPVPKPVAVPATTPVAVSAVLAAPELPPLPLPTMLTLPTLPAMPRQAVVEELEEAELVEEAGWSELLERYSIDQVSRELARAEDRETIADILLHYMAEEFELGALFIVRGDAVSGWRAVRHGRDIEDFQNFCVPLTRPSVLKTVIEGRSYYLGPIADTPLDRRLRAALGDQPAPILLVPLIVAGRVVNLLLMQGGRTELGDRFAEVHRLLNKASLAFEILISREKILMI
jgi:hypothetical protein